MTTTRFAPSPTGLLHLGHAYSALHAASFVDRKAGDRFLVRLEDIDIARCRPEFEAAILEDLAWLGLDWERPVRRQSDHMDDYRAALDRLEGMGLLYKCFHSRKELDEALSAPHNRPMMGPDGPAVTGTDALMPQDERARREAAGEPYALRLRMEEAVRRAGPLTWRDRTHGEQAARPEVFGDVVLARKDVATSYHLAVTVDDALQGVTLVTRGEDLFQASHVHRLLQALLDLPAPDYAHHPLLVDPETGRRFAKRDRSLTLKALRDSGVSAAEVRTRVGFG
ncbi:tRNA glutamyl-Q(34) synthetase GluQRS [Thalassobaculum sp. OXR-137]|uniref:tRNA glutamyl-Q(34) synthetase GluQRS n=1 Tax=Thalassobaculum sp. OXR-137 TaxID=3100173 RepID=UPI002AC944D8|nr:tRNA glutamyl-Q(34) synthetase GluQRS [Thalassobaculum sp. OXR-137]WPZ35362.1 tRNA glutamyl-Q(34) synthetase GluQRS [Thalassobaculum sp. OXR-137]